MTKWLAIFLVVFANHVLASQYTGEANSVTTVNRNTPVLLAQLTDEAIRKAIRKADLKAVVGNTNINDDDVIMSKVYWPLMVTIIDKEVVSQPCKVNLYCSKVTVLIEVDEDTFVEQMKELWMTTQIERNANLLHKYPSHVFMSQIAVLEQRIKNLERAEGDTILLEGLRAKVNELELLLLKSKQLRLAYEINKHYTNMGIFGEPIDMKRVTSESLAVTFNIRGYGDQTFEDKFPETLNNLGYVVTPFNRAVQQGGVREGLTVGLGWSGGPLLKAGQLCIRFESEEQYKELSTIVGGQSTLTIPLLGIQKYVRVGDMRSDVPNIWPNTQSNTLCVWTRFEYQYDITINEADLAYYAQYRLEDLPMKLVFDMAKGITSERGVEKQTVPLESGQVKMGKGARLPILESDMTTYHQYLVVGCDTETFACRKSESTY